VNSIVRFFNKLRLLLQRNTFDRDLAEEMAYHRDLKEKDLQGLGLHPQDAQFAARREFGNDTSLKEQSRDVIGFWFESTLQDFRFSLRLLKKNMVFTVTAIVVLGLGMCASISIFAFVDAALIQPLPYHDPSRLVGVFEKVALFDHSNLSIPDYLDWKKSNTSFTSLEAYQHHSVMLQGPSGAEPGNAARVSDGFFRVLGVVPVLGRDFYAGEDLLSAPRTVLLSYAAWQKRYAGKADVLGQSVLIDGDPHIIIGVLPRQFHFVPAEPAEFWTSLHASSECDLRRSCHGFYGVARLKDGVSLPASLAELESIAQRLQQQYPDSNSGQDAAVAALSDVIVGDVRPIFLLLLCGAGLLLVIATVNVSSLLLVRSESRKREMAVRGALGASPARLIRQFVTEGVVLVVAGTTLGMASAYWTMQLLIKLIPADLVNRLAFLHTLGLNSRVLAFSAAIAFLAVLLFTLTPSIRLYSPEMHQSLAEGSRGSAGNTWRRLGSKLVVLELATAVVLLVVAGLLGKSLYRLLRVDIGLQPDHLVVLQVSAPNAGYGEDQQAIALERRVVSKLSELPGVTSVGISSVLPVDGWGNTSWFRVLGRPWHGEHNEAPERDVSTEYFAALGAKLLRGRNFTEAEEKSKPHVVIINQAFAREYFPGQDPLGQHLAYISHEPVPIEIVGIVQDIKEGQLDSENKPAMYIPFNQSPGNYFNLAVRTSQSEQALLPALVAGIHQIDPGIAAFGGATMADVIDDSPSAYIHRSSAWLVGGFAGVALLLGVVGLYGVVAYSVSQRTREIGVRMALGAQRQSVYQLILREAGWLTGLGIVIGLAFAVAAATLMRGILFTVRSWDLPTLAGVAVLLGGAAMLASFIPARRAASVDPVEALRTE
jgi:macrolide transport system ATP-binding/permease protein